MTNQRIKYCFNIYGLLISTILGFCFLGISIWAATNTIIDPRAIAIEKYVKSVNAWTNNNRIPFASSLFSIKASIASKAVSTEQINLVQDESLDILLADTLSINYKPLRYSLGANSAMLGTNSILPYYPDDFLDLMIISESQRRIQSTFNLSSILKNNLPVLIKRSAQNLAPSKVTGSTKQQCDSLGGILDVNYNVCYVFQQLVSICIQVSQNLLELQTWGFDISRGGIGCNPLSSWTEVGSYIKIRATGDTTDSPFSKPIDFSGINVTIRSVFDPLLEAMEITSGTLYFGSSYKTNGLLFWIMLFLGFLFLGRPFLLCCSECRRDGTDLNMCGDLLLSTFVIPFWNCIRGVIIGKHILRLPDDRNEKESSPSATRDPLESAQQPLDVSNEVLIEIDFASNKPRSRSSRGTSPS
jgi:hypothetical protein